jgi:hypothetical protein
MSVELGLSTKWKNRLRVLKGIFGPEGEKSTGWWGNLFSEELCNFPLFTR